MNDQTVPTSDNLDQSVGAVRSGLVHITFLIQIVIHSIAAMYAHTSTRPLKGPKFVGGP
jgi:hypothetical protein